MEWNLQRPLHQAQGPWSCPTGAGRVLSGQHLLFTSQTTTEFPSGNLYNVQTLLLSERAEKERRPAFAFISLDRGEIRSYVEGKESQALTLSSSACRGTRGPDDGGGLTWGCSRYWKPRRPKAESSTHSQKAYPQPSGKKAGSSLRAGPPGYTLLSLGFPGMPRLTG